MTATASADTKVVRLSTEAEQEGGYTSLAKAARIIGAKAPSTVFRAIKDGIALPDGSRVFLEAIRSGKKMLTTKASLQRFLEAQQPGQSVQTPPLPRSPSARRKASEAAAAKADKLLA